MVDIWLNPLNGSSNLLAKNPVNKCMNECEKECENEYVIRWMNERMNE